MDQEVFRPMFYGLIMWVVTIYAFRRGGWEERLASANMVVATYASVLVMSPYGAFRHIEISMAVVDATMLFIQQLIAFRSKKFWPLWLAAIQGVTVLGHLAPLMPDIGPSTSYNAVSLWSYPAWILVAFAVYAHNRRLAITSYQAR